MTNAAIIEAIKDMIVRELMEFIEELRAVLLGRLTETLEEFAEVVKQLEETERTLPHPEGGR